MKKYLALITVLLMAVSLCACSVESTLEHDSKVSSLEAAAEKNGEGAQRETDDATDSDGEVSTDKTEKISKTSKKSTESAEQSAAYTASDNSSEGADVNVNQTQPLVTAAPADTIQSAYSYYVTENSKTVKTSYITGATRSEKKSSTTISKSSSANKTPSVASGDVTKAGTSKSTAKAKISVSQNAVNISSILTDPNLKESVKNSLPADGILIPAYSKITVTEGSTVFDALELVLKAERETYKNAKAMLEYRSSGYGNYIYSIAGLAEKDCGAQSGWTYKVNGKTPGVSCDKYVLKAGDVVEWLYVTKS